MENKGMIDVHPLLTDRARLSIMALLAATKERVDFLGLLGSLGMTKGNLSSHLRRLEDEGLIEVTKSFIERKPHSAYRCTEAGREAVQRYLVNVEKLLKEVGKV